MAKTKEKDLVIDCNQATNNNKIQQNSITHYNNKAIIPPGDATEFLPESLIDAYWDVQQSIWKNEEEACI